LPNGYFDDCWSKLNQALEKILTSSQPLEGLQNLYQVTIYSQHLFNVLIIYSYAKFYAEITKVKRYISS
jgi:hypothetical protein